jgi:RNA polymerase sigma-70 factor, ECF subfamily
MRYALMIYAEPGYDELTGSPVVELNRAVALAQAGDPAGALRAVDRLGLDGYCRLGWSDGSDLWVAGRLH